MANEQATFLGLPSELRCEIYKQLMLYRKPINPWFQYRRPRRFSGLLRTSKMIHAEAIPILYGHNAFDLTETRLVSEVEYFIENIGRNKSYLRHMVLNFPQPYHLDGADTERLFAAMKQHCTGLKRLGMPVSWLLSKEIALGPVEKESILSGIKAIDSLLAAFPQLEDVVIDEYGGGLDDYWREQMCRLGWRIRPMKYDSREGMITVVTGDNDAYESDFDGFSGCYNIGNSTKFWKRKSVDAV